MKKVVIAIVFLFAMVQAADVEMEAIDLCQLQGYTVEECRFAGMNKYLISWPDGRGISAFNYPGTDNWAFNVRLQPNIYYQVSCEGTECTGALTFNTCQRIKEIVREWEQGR